MNFRELLNKLDEVDAAGLDPATAPAGAAQPAAVDPAKQAAYQRAQAAMANLEKAAQYSGTDEIVRSRFGLPPKLPPIDQWDGKMPQAGEADWMTKNLFGRQAVKDIGAAQTQNAADASTIATAQAQLKQLNDLLAKFKTSVKEGIDADIARQLIESFGYTQEQLDELSMQDVGDFGRGMWHGATLGAGSNLAAGAKSLVKGTKYKDELEKELSADKTAAERSPWAYNAGDIGGAIGSSFVIPGAGVGNLAARGAAKLGGGALAQGLARGAGQIGANLAIQKGVDTALDAHNKDVLGKQGQAGAKPGATDPKLAQLQKMIGAKADGIMGPETKQKLQAWQQSQGITADGVPGPETYGKAGIKENVAETMSDLRAKLAMLETEQQTDEGIWDTVANAGSKLVKGIGQGFNNPGIRNLPNLATAQRVGANIGTAGNKIAGAAGKAASAAKAAGAKTAGAAKAAGSAMARNPGKTALGTAALGYGLSQLGPDGKPVPGTKPTGGKTPSGGQGAADTTSTQPVIDPASMEEIQNLMSALAQVNDPEIQQGLAQARQTLSQITGDKNIGSADKPQASNATANTTGGPNMGQVNAPSVPAAAKPTNGTPPVKKELTPQQQAQNVLQPGMNK